jgi:para-nitrobenzyl esterase
MQKSFGMTEGQAAELAKLYPLDEFKGRPVEAMGRMFGADATMQCPTHRSLMAMVENGNKGWFYRFEYHGMKKGKYAGSFHTAELPFIFDAFDRSPGPMFYKGMDLVPEKQLSEIMQAYWTNFAKTGDPNGPGLPEWNSFNPSDQYVQILNTGKVQSEPVGVVEDRCEFWDEYTDDFLPLANELIGSLF